MKLRVDLLLSLNKSKKKRQMSDKKKDKRVIK
jgi:hypothetical protein